MTILGAVWTPGLSRNRNLTYYVGYGFRIQRRCLQLSVQLFPFLSLRGFLILTMVVYDVPGALVRESQCQRPRVPRVRVLCTHFMTCPHKKVHFTCVLPWWPVNYNGPDRYCNSTCRYASWSICRLREFHNLVYHCLAVGYSDFT